MGSYVYAVLERGASYPKICRNMALIWINYRLIDVLEDFWYMKKVIDILGEGDRYFWYIFESSRQIWMAQWDWLLMKASGIEFFLVEFDIEDMWFESFPNRQVPTWRVSGKSRSELMCANCSIEGLVCFVSLLSYMVIYELLYLSTVERTHTHTHAWATFYYVCLRTHAHVYAHDCIVSSKYRNIHVWDLPIVQLRLD